MEMIPALVDLFLSQTRDADSYLYLTAIDGLTALARVAPEGVIPSLLVAYK